MSTYLDDHKKLQDRPFNPWLRRLQIVTFPVVFILVFVIAPGWTVARRLELPIGLGASAAMGLGIAICALGGSLYLWTIVLFAGAWGTQVPVAPTRRLVTTGPYAVSRNPMVTSAIIMICGVGVWRDSWSFVLAGLVLPSLYLLYIKLVEEAELEARFGADYVAYKQRTPFVLPTRRG